MHKWKSTILSYCLRQQQHLLFIIESKCCCGCKLWPSMRCRANYHGCRLFVDPGLWWKPPTVPMIWGTTCNRTNIFDDKQIVRRPLQYPKEMVILFECSQVSVLPMSAEETAQLCTSLSHSLFVEKQSISFKMTPLTMNPCTGVSYRP